MNPALWIVGLAVGAATMTWRIEPAFPQIASDLSISLQTAAALASGFGLAYAFVQPAMGAIADRYGKPQVMLWGLVTLVISTLACAFAPTYEFLFIFRMVAGAAAGSIAPLSLGLAADLSELKERQVAISRVIMGSMTGAVTGGAFAGGLSDLVGWRVMFVVLAALNGIAFVTFWKRLRLFHASHPTDSGSLSTLFVTYKKIFMHRTALVCFFGVFIEGGTIYGMFPYVPSFFVEQGETRLFISGIVIAAFALGILLYTAAIKTLLSTFNVRQLMVIGGIISASQMLVIIWGPIWQIQFLSFAIMGFGFYLMHGALQAFVSEVSTVHRGKAMALHGFFYFLGQSVFTIAYGFFIFHFGKTVALGIGAMTLVALGLVFAATLSHRPQVN